MGNNQPLMSNEPLSTKEHSDLDENTATKELADRLGDAHMNILPRKKLLITMTAMAFNLSTAFADQTAVTIALPAIAEDLNSQSTINWAGTASLLANCVCQVLFGRLADIFGRKVVLLGALIILALADLSCGFAQTGVQFYIFRAFAGIGTGGIQNLTMTLISDIVTLEQRGKYQGILGANVGLGNAIGPFLMSAFVQHSSWRNFYHMMPAIVFIQIVTTYIFVEDRHEQLNSVLSRLDKFKKIDYLGMFFGTASLTLVLVPLNGGGSTYSWNSVLVIVMFIVGGCCFIVFLFIEWKIPKLPIVPLSLFTLPNLNLILTSNFLYGIAYYSLQYFLPYYFQIIRDFSELKSAILLLPLVLVQAASSTAAGQIITISGHYKHVIVIGYLLWTVASGLMLIFNITTNIGTIVGVLLVMGVGVGFTFQPSMVAALSQSRKADRAVVVSTRNVVRSLGGAMGIAIASLIISNSLTVQVNKAFNDPNDYNNIPISYLHYLKSHIYNKIEITGLNSAQVLTVKQMYLHSIRNYFYMNVPLIGLCFISTLFIRDKGLHSIDELPENTNKDETVTSTNTNTKAKTVQ